ncbi:type VI secretion system baseplate subunit TssE [Avibacterium volantium]|uniref:type VI secretion system baseplate subunit TssE n=1 Tax=Avibacterium TaxID=292486 RepID=UPI002026E153|nr:MULTISPECIES: type VI secretion system baseplate subunit TssE [unclassified Avibacterium]URL01344.1 type VI secretion system baseplate subunit TssE [Avibacterium sp. 20-126]MCW9716001.1 type VI secretion system baseplate subunit TssE [Avibacterium sp. 21-594]MCW9718650.1 type VI secretion system baseplate subunit TssE [Avibacterium sp. 21-599]MCW9734086.1 type VI secretion system baseplate subunit TssE [Avibacterium sp. 20-15]URL03733.1 type VI secretion system baseplate subunit TssE [Aviba
MALLSWQRDSTASLFERIQGKEVNPSPLSHSGLKTFIESIKHNLNNILNTHPGTSQSAVQLGIMDLNDATSNTGDIYQKISQIIQECILNFEPRIIAVNVTPFPNEEQPLTLFFYVTATVSFEDYTKDIAFNLHLDNDHRYYLDMSNIT